jgi:hypothetical protein
MSDTGWRWKVECFYGPDVKPPKYPGALAISTVHRTDESKDMEVQVAEAREDIGEVLISYIAPREFA